MLGSKFKVTYDPIEKLEKGEITELPCQIPCYTFIPKSRYQRFLSIFSQWTTIEEISHIPAEMNNVFPDIKPLTIQEMLRLWTAR